VQNEEKSINGESAKIVHVCVSMHISFVMLLPVLYMGLEASCFGVVHACMHACITGHRHFSTNLSTYFMSVD